MKCSKCGFENRPGARFCKKCGDPLPAQTPPPPTPAGVICPACGATAKPGARFCPRCGKQLPARPAPSPAPSAPSSTQPSMPPQSYARPPYQPPPPAAPPTPHSRSSRWLVWGGAAVAFLCIVAIVVAAVFVAPKYLGGEEEPTPTPTSAPSPTAPPPTEPPSPEPPTETSPPTAFDAQVAIAASAAELHVGEFVTVTVTITNTGEVTFGHLRYRLRDWQPFLTPIPEPEAIHEMDVPPGGSDTATFRLEATQVGAAQILATVTVETREEPSTIKPVSSEQVIEISVVE